MIHVIIFVSDSKLKQNNLCFRFHLNVKLKLPVTFDFESLHYLKKINIVHFCNNDSIQLCSNVFLHSEELNS